MGRRSDHARQIARALALVFAPTGGFAAAPVGVEPPGTPVPFSALPGFDSDGLASAFRAFRGSCAALVDTSAPLRSAVRPPPELKSVCAAATVRALKPTEIRGFFERHFVPRRISEAAFFTGYYEPVVAGSLVATKSFATPLYARPADLVAVVPGSKPDLDPVLTTARRLPDGRFVALPDRAGIETGGLGAAARPLVFVESPLEAYFIHIQGSARIKLRDGTLRRLVYAGRNGYPYASIGKILVQRLKIPPSAMGLAQLRDWIREHGQGDGDAGTALMRENRSFIFFRFDDTLPASVGPVGGQGLSLTPLRSLAIDRTIWPYGLPFYVDTILPDATPFRHLMIGQDTGAAILGRARADIFFGTGEDAARRAGAIRQPGTLFVLWPKPLSKKPSDHRP